MIIDYRKGSERASMYEILDVDAGKWLTDQTIFYADDEKGILGLYLTRDGTTKASHKDSHPIFEYDPVFDGVPIVKRKANIKICLKDGIDDPEKELARRAEEWVKFKRGEEANLEW